MRTVALLLAGVAIGAAATLGLSGRTSRPPPLAEATQPPQAAATVERADLAAELEALRRAVAAEQARLDRLVQERATASSEPAQPPRPARAPAAAREEAVPVPRPVPPAREETPASTVAARAPVPPPIAAPPAPPRPRADSAAGGLPRVVVHHRAGSAAAQEAAQSTLTALREAGFDVAELRPVPAVPSQRVVRYFHAEDAASAARLAGRLGRGWAIQDFRAYEPAPSQQLLEVWLPER